MVVRVNFSFPEFVRLQFEVSVFFFKTLSLHGKLENTPVVFN